MNLVEHFIVIMVILYLIAYSTSFLFHLYLYNFQIVPCWKMEAERIAEHNHIVSVINRIQGEKKWT